MIKFFNKLSSEENFINIFYVAIKGFSQTNFDSFVNSDLCEFMNQISIVKNNTDLTKVLL